MGHINNNMGAIGHNNINKGHNYHSNGVITSIIETQHVQSQTSTSPIQFHSPIRRFPRYNTIAICSKAIVVPN